MNVRPAATAWPILTDGELERWRRWQTLTPETMATICLFCLRYPADPPTGISCVGCSSMGSDSVNSPKDGAL